MLRSFLNKENRLTALALGLLALGVPSLSSGALPDPLTADVTTLQKEFNLVPPEARLLYDDIPDELLTETQRRGRESAASIARDISSDGQPSSQFQPDSSIRTWAGDLARNAIGLADPALSANREKVMDFLGLSDESSRVYIFVSFSMPMDMLKAYALSLIHI